VFLQGLIAARDVSLWPAIPGVDPKTLVAWLEGESRALRRESPADLALAYVRGQDWIDGIVVGMETEAQLDDNLALFRCPALSREECAEIEGSRPRVPVPLLDPAQWPNP